MRPSRKQSDTHRKLLVLDTSYSYDAICDRGLEGSVTCRDLGGFFAHVWTVHPVASLVSNDQSQSGRPIVHKMTKGHTFLDGKVGRFTTLERLPVLNFAVAQASLIWELTQLIRVERISVIRAGDPLYNGLLGLLLARACKIPLLVRVGANHDKTFEVTGRPMMPRLFKTRAIEKAVGRFVLSHADMVAGANQDNLDFAFDNGAKPERSTLFRYGNLIHEMHFREPEMRDKGEEYLHEHNVIPDQFLLYIGRFESVKHPEDVVKVLAGVRQQGHDVKLVMAGTGQLLEKLKDLTRELDVEDSVVFCGNQEQEWLAQVIPLASVVVSPHTGRALSEVALGGAPIVAYDIDWQSELIETGVTGTLVPHLALDSMVDAVARLLDNPPHARELGKAARERAIGMMDPELLNQNERDVYSSLIDK